MIARGCLILLVLASLGCSLTAKKTPTPAAQIDKDELAHRTPPPGERFYVILYGSQNALHQPKYSHTWATLVRTRDVPGQAQPEVDSQTISWLPATLEIKPARFSVEPGVNIGNEETIEYVQQNGEKVHMWGPYEVWHGFAYRFEIQKAFLDSGAVGYQCTDTVGEAARTGNGCDCIHAVSDMDPAYPRSRYPLAVYGPPATANLVRRLMHSGGLIDPRATHDWLLEPLKLTDPALIRRTYHGTVQPYRPDF